MTKQIDLARLEKLKLESLVGRALDKRELQSIVQVCGKYPARVSGYTLNLMEKRPEIARQYIPNCSELETIAEIPEKSGSIEAERIFNSSPFCILTAYSTEGEEIISESPNSLLSRSDIIST